MISAIRRVPRDIAVAATAAALLGCGAESRSPEAVRPINPIGVSNSVGRDGAYYEPARLPDTRVPVLVLLHPTGSSGRSFIPAFQSLADSLGFVIVAPDSRTSPDGIDTWQVGDRPREVTEDLTHVLAALEWVRRHTLLDFDDERILVAGFSGGASSAPYVATNRSPFSHAAILHGRAFPTGFGPRSIPLWLSTGDTDELAPVSSLRTLAADLRSRGLTVTVRTYPAGHVLTNDEKSELVSWWLTF